MVDFNQISDPEIYTQALMVLKDAGVNFMLGGAFAVYHYTGWWRSTHDIDIYITVDQLDVAKSALAAAGFEDLGEQAKGDREWIYHAGKNSIVVDVIYRFANLANYVHPDWFTRAPTGRFLDIDVMFLPLEELIWIKIFVINRHRCDWPDIMRLIRAQCGNLNWNRLIDILGEHWLLLEGLICVFDWTNPGSMDCIPDQIRDELARRHAVYHMNPVDINREHLLDPWLYQRADKYVVRRNE